MATKPHGRAGTATKPQVSEAGAGLAAVVKIEPTWRSINEMSAEDIADELGWCKWKVGQVAKYEKRAKELSAAVLAACPDLQLDQAGILKGRKWTIQIAAKTMVSRILDIRKVYRAMGAEAFWNACTVTLEAIENAVSPEKYATLVVKEQVGYRKVTAVPQQAQLMEPPAHDQAA